MFSQSYGVYITLLVNNSFRGRHTCTHASQYTICKCWIDSVYTLIARYFQKHNHNNNYTTRTLILSDDHKWTIHMCTCMCSYKVIKTSLYEDHSNLLQWWLNWYVFSLYSVNKYTPIATSPVYWNVVIHIITIMWYIHLIAYNFIND